MSHARSRRAARRVLSGRTTVRRRVPPARGGARSPCWLEPVDPMRRDFRGRTKGHEAEIVEGDLADIASCDGVLAAFTSPDEGTAMEAWYAHSRGIRVVAYTGGTPAHPWTRYVAESMHASLQDAVRALS